MLNVLTWYWQQPGGRAEYLPEHVNIWARMVRQNLSIPHKISCVTNTPNGIDSSINIIKPPGDFENVRIPSWDNRKPQCHRRLAMFSPDAAEVFGDRFVCMDLDCIISGPLDPLFTARDDFKIMVSTEPKARPYNGSMLLMTAGSRPQVYTEFTPERAALAGKHFLGSDQSWIAFCLGWDEAVWGEKDGVIWFSMRYSMKIPKSRVMFFPGSMKPWIVAGTRPLDKWVIDTYYGKMKEAA